jgi:hypothetical protein
MRIAGKLAPVAAAVSALATLACCLPLGIAGAAGALGLSVVAEPVRPWLMGLAVVLLGAGFVEMYRGRKMCRRSGLHLVLLGLPAAVVLGVILFPQEFAELLAALPLHSP